MALRLRPQPDGAIHLIWLFLLQRRFSDLILRTADMTTVLNRNPIREPHAPY
jgi:hypothetical protein